MAKGVNEFSAIIYYSKEDGCWIAHSVHTDQIGTGERVVDALAGLIRAMNALYEAAKADSTVLVFRKAPKEVLDKAKGAKKLPREVYEVAHRMVHGEWPKDVVVDVSPRAPKYPTFTTKFEFAGA